MSSRRLLHLAWKQRGPILISALHKFVTYGTILIYLDTYPLTYSPGTHAGAISRMT